MVTVCAQLADTFRAEIDLWVVPPTQEAAWFSRLDWYLNWQLSKGLAHVSARPSPEVIKIAQDSRIKMEKPMDVTGKPLLVMCQSLVPAEKCLLISGSSDYRKWANEIHAQAVHLNAKSVQIFHPAQVPANKLKAAWEKLNPSLDLQLASEELL